MPGSQPVAHRFGGMKAEVGHCPGGVTADPLQVTETAQPVNGGGPRPPEAGPWAPGQPGPHSSSRAPDPASSDQAKGGSAQRGSGPSVILS